MDKIKLEEDESLKSVHTSEPLIDYPGYSDYDFDSKKKKRERRRQEQPKKEIKQKEKVLKEKPLKEKSLKEKPVKDKPKREKPDKEKSSGIVIKRILWVLLFIPASVIFLFDALFALLGVILGAAAIAGVAAGLLIFAYGLFNIFTDNATALAMSGAGILAEAVSALLIFTVIIIFSKGVPVIRDIAINLLRKTYPSEGK